MDGGLDNLPLSNVTLTLMGQLPFHREYNFSDLTLQFKTYKFQPLSLSLTVGVVSTLIYLIVSNNTRTQFKA